MYSQTVLPAICVIAALLTSGCYETKSTYTINPDGTGKVHLEARFQPMMLSMGETKDPESKAREAARGLIKKAKGIDIWKDVTVKAGEDGRTVFGGTGYFRDVSRVKFQNLGDSAVSVVREDDTFTLTVEMGDEDKDAKEAPEKTEMTEEEIVAAIKAQRAEYLASKPMMAGFFAAMKSENTFILPGTLKRSTNVTKSEDGGLSVKFDGTKLLAAIDRMMADDAVVRESVVSGRKMMQDGPGGGLEMNEALLGKKAPIEAVMAGPFEPLFDYEAEVKAAREAYPAMAKTLKIRDAALMEPVKPGEGLKGVTVGGVRYVRDVEKETGLRPFNQKAGYSLCLIAEFDGAIVSLDEAVLDRAVTDTGADLLPEREWDRKAHFPRLGDDHTAAQFTFNLAPLDKSVRGIGELCGVVRYRCAGTTRKADVGITRFETGVRGSEFRANIKSLKPAEWMKGGTTVSLELELDKKSIKSVTFYDKDDFEIEFDGTGSSSWGDEKCSFDYTTKGEFPAEGRIVVEVYEAQRKHEVPFTISNIDLFGNPTK